MNFSTTYNEYITIYMDAYMYLIIYMYIWSLFRLLEHKIFAMKSDEGKESSMFKSFLYKLYS